VNCRRLVRSDRGAATLAAVALCGVLVVGLVCVAILGRAAAQAQRTRSAADLAALAGAVAVAQLSDDPCGRSAEIARRNAAVQQSCQVRYPVQGAEVTVAVRSATQVWPVGWFAAHARAGLRPISQRDG